MADAAKTHHPTQEDLIAEFGQPPEGLSKNAVKKWFKQKQNDAKKAAKDAANAGKQPSGKAKKEEEILDPTQFKANREAMVKSVEAAGGSVYPHKFHVDYRIPDYCTKFNSETTPGEHLKDQVVSIAGRVVAVRGQGKLYFYDIHGDGAKVQVMSKMDHYASGDGAFQDIHRMLKRGDVIGIKGNPGKSMKEELSIFATEITLLAPCLHMLPFAKGDSSLGGITNLETRYRQRYLDLIVNTDVRKTFETRSRLIQGIRRYLDDRHFLEVETVSYTHLTLPTIYSV